MNPFDELPEDLEPLEKLRYELMQILGCNVTIIPIDEGIRSGEYPEIYMDVDEEDLMDAVHLLIAKFDDNIALETDFYTYDELYI